MKYNNCDFCNPSVPVEYATRDNVCNWHNSQYYPDEPAPRKKVKPKGRN